MISSFVFDILSVIRQKGESQNRCFKKTKHVKFSVKTNITYLLLHTGFVNVFGEYNFVAFCKKRLDLAISADSGKGERFPWI